jgi:O-antigen/teichoic acid export membrane protein
MSGVVGLGAARLRRLAPSTEEGVAVAGGAVVAFALQVAGAGLAYLTQLFLARWLGAQEFGVYTFTVGWSTIAAVAAGLGLATAVLRFVPLYLRSERLGHLRGLLRLAIACTVGVGAAIALLGTAAFLVFDPGLEGGRAAAIIGLWSIPLLALLTLQQEVARSLGRATLAYLPPLILRPVLVLVAAAALVGAGHSLTAALALGLTAAAVAIAVAVQSIGIHERLGVAVRRAATVYEARHWLTTAAPMLLVSGFVIVLLQTDVIMVGAFLGPRDAGIYGAAAKTATLVSLVPIAANALAAPVLGSMIAERRPRRDAQRLTSAVAVWSFWPSLAISVVLAIGSTQILALFGAGFSGGSTSLDVLLLGQVVNAGAGAVGWLMLLSGNQREAAWVYGCVAIGHVALLAVCVPLLGMIGAAIVTTVSYTVWNLWLNSLVVRRLGLHPSIGFALRGHELISVSTQERPGEGGD